jgi:hypothetical protein
VLSLAVWSGLFEGRWQDQGCTVDPAVVWVPGVTQAAPPPPKFITDTNAKGYIQEIRTKIKFTQ